MQQVAEAEEHRELRRNFETGKYKCKACEYGFFAKKAYDKHRKTQGHKVKEKKFNEKRVVVSSEATGESVNVGLLDEVQGL